MSVGLAAFIVVHLVLYGVIAHAIVWADDSRLTVHNGWPAYLGVRPYARVMTCRRLLDVQLEAYTTRSETTARFKVSVCNVTLLLLAAGYWRRLHALTAQPDSAWWAVGLLGFTLSWHHHRQLPT